MTTAQIFRLEQKMRGWQLRAQQLHQIYQQEGRQVTLQEAREAEAKVEALRKDIKKRRECW